MLTGLGFGVGVGVGGDEITSGHLVSATMAVPGDRAIEDDDHAFTAALRALGLATGQGAAPQSPAVPGGREMAVRRPFTGAP